MIAIPSGVSIFLCTTATDMRKSFDGLTGLVRSEFSREPNDGSLFLFINRRRDRIKILYWEAGGFALWYKPRDAVSCPVPVTRSRRTHCDANYKRLESGSFETVTGNKGESVVTIDAAELSMLLSGISLQSVKRRKRFVA